MERNVLFHNPRCSKSRATLALLQKENIDIEVEEYLKSPPTLKELDYICRALGIKATNLIRTKENRFSELGLAIDDQRSHKMWLTILHDNPVLLERPILIYNQKVAIGRPPENVLSIIR